MVQINVNSISTLKTVLTWRVNITKPELSLTKELLHSPFHTDDSKVELDT